ncbi:hypothetical protein GQ53DRAFT_445433 [Thozetella sp. PMI_491]|nr:hypothetical protein GQ53DRAFT_445433 [Thozetella sp. PMI_491]
MCDKADWHRSYRGGKSTSCRKTLATVSCSFSSCKQSAAIRKLCTSKPHKRATRTIWSRNCWSLTKTQLSLPTKHGMTSL